MSDPGAARASPSARTQAGPHELLPNPRLIYSAIGPSEGCVSPMWQLLPILTRRHVPAAGGVSPSAQKLAHKEPLNVDQKKCPTAHEVSVPSPFSLKVEVRGYRERRNFLSSRPPGL